MKALNFFMIFYSFFIYQTSYAGDYTDLTNISQQSEKFLKNLLQSKINERDHQYLKIATRPLDPRLKLAPCDKPLTLEDPSRQAIKGNIAIKVSCRGQISWAVYVRHNISLEKEVLAVSNSLPRQHILTDNDLHYVTRDIYLLRQGYYSDKQAIVGQQLKRPITIDKVIYNYQLQAPDIIKKGDEITIIARHGSLSVVSPGVALTNGKKGKQIKVENRRSSRIIYAKVIGPSKVQVIL